MFMTPCTNPTDIHPAMRSAVRSVTVRKNSTYVAGDGAPSSGKYVVNTVSKYRLSNDTSSRAAKISKLPNRTKDGATRHTMAPGSARGLPS
ncbi:MAG: hypothetical protein QM784_37440 [Polyangiaceae bacterium]